MAISPLKPGFVYSYFACPGIRAGGSRTAALLDLYDRVRLGKQVPDDPSNPLTAPLRLSGIVRSEGGLLRERHRIYARVFDRRWVQANMPDQKRHRLRAAYRKGFLRSAGFDVFVEDRCAKFYDDGSRGGRPGLAPGVYFRCLLVGYFEGIDSERGIDWRCNDSLSLKAFLGVAIDGPAPDHSTISRTRPGRRA